MTEPALDIVIPVYNEGSNILSALAALKREVRTPFRVLICYDMDDDDTLPAIASLPAGSFDIRLVKNGGRGPHSAIRAGFAASLAPAVLVYMADDDCNAKIVEMMLAKFRQGCDVVAASRFVPGGSMTGCSWFKTMITRIGAFLMFFLARAGVHDPTNAFKLFSRRVLDTIEIESRHGFTLAAELLVKAVRLGWPVAEVPMNWFERKDKPSRFRLLAWLPHYIRWLFYAMSTTYLFRGPETVKRRKI